MAARQSNKVAIFGGCGFVGSALTRELVTTDRFDNVFVVDDLSAGKTWLLPDDPRVQFIQGDARDIELSFLGNPDLVYYLCADPYVPDSFRDPEHTINRNVGVLESFLKINSESLPEHLVYVSSGEVYGSVAIGCTSESDILKTEDLVQSSPYALSRVLAESTLRRATRNAPGSVVALRLFNVVGPASTHPYFIPDIVSQAIRNPHVQHGDLTTIRDFVWIGDVIDAMGRAAGRAPAGFTALNISTGTGWTMQSIIEIIARALGKPELDLQFDQARLRPIELARLVGCPSRARDVLGWRATTSIHEAIRRTIDWYQANGRWPYEAA
jgi:nucleoside-diphosphate-sugar epimerase